MDLALVANVYFEEELAGNPLRFHPLLQYLPLVYGDKSDVVLVDRLPPADFINEGPVCRLQEEKDLSSLTLSPWGFSEQVVSFAQNRKLIVPERSLESIRTVSSKGFCFSHGFGVKGGALITTKDELLRWSRSVKGPKILKAFYGMTGRGHYIYADDEPNYEHFPVIAEPFVKRTLDFSTQWFLDDKIHFLGATHLINHEKGSYRATRVGDEKELFGGYYEAVQEAIEVQKGLLEKAFKIGFRGYCGIDAMIYKGGFMQPALEINGRRTMGQVALLLAQKTGKGGELFFSSELQKNAKPLLPFLKKNQKQLYFSSF